MAAALAPRLACVIAIVSLACGDRAEKTETGHPMGPFHEEVAEAHPTGYARPYEFSDDWFTGQIPNWKRLFGSLAGKPDLHYLEIGVYEGRSFFWMMENVLTHPSSRATGIDIFIPRELGERFRRNVEISGQQDRITTVEGYSQIELRELPLESFDIIYVDGSHTADDVLTDATLSFGLLKVGGILLFDDYLWNGSYYAGRDSHLPSELVPDAAINAFARAFSSYLEVLHQGLQIAFRKRPNPCPNKVACSHIGPYTYEWQSKEFFEGPERTPVELSLAERRQLEEILWTRGLRGRGLVLPPRVSAKPGVLALVERLDLELAPTRAAR